MVVFGRKYQKDKEKIWKIGGAVLESREEYTYLGLEVERRRGWKRYKERMLCKAMRVNGLVKVMVRRN